jgi:MinD-like ATPase involved in chromosome partitioning or flagellar assembly
MADSTRIFFDESLAAFVDGIAEALGEDYAAQGIVLRDTTGRLRFISNRSAPSRVEIDTLVTHLLEKVGPYLREDNPVQFSGGIESQGDIDAEEALPLKVGQRWIRIVDRRIIGPAWLERPTETVAFPPRIVFASVKGGVGRSTALAVTAADLARRGRNVLVIDLDLEAPGVGDLLIREAQAPRYGAVDYLVESGISSIPDFLFDQFIATSDLTIPEGGRVDVVPAFGKSAKEYPENVLPKLSRAMLDDIESTGELIKVGEQIAELIKTMSARGPYDVVLIDARAGLTELAAPVLLGLGAEVLLFGTAQTQTIRSYAGLFAALRMLALRDRGAQRLAEWRGRFQAVHAKASLNDENGKWFREEWHDLFATYLYDEDEPEDDGEMRFNFGVDELDAPHWPWVIPFTQNFVDFDPLRFPGHLAMQHYEQAFRPFLDRIDLVLQEARESQSIEEWG